MRKAPPLAALAALAIAAVWALAGSWGGGSPVGALRTARADREGHSGLEGFGAVREGEFKRLYRDPEGAAPRRRACARLPRSRPRGPPGRPGIAVQTVMRGSP